MNKTKSRPFIPDKYGLCLVCGCTFSGIDLVASRKEAIELIQNEDKR